MRFLKPITYGFPVLFLIILISFKFVNAQPKGWFEFAMPNLDTSHTMIDMSHLNEEQAGQSGYIRVDNGHFTTGNGERIKFIGTNLTFSNAFPDKNLAPVIAARLAKLGYNIMRFHHMDYRSAPAGIWNKDQTDFDPDQLDKLDWLIYHLKQNGIYTNINLHVSRSYPGVTEENFRFNYGKSIDNYFRPYIEMQKSFAEKLLNHKNPYTGTSYVEEPAVAFVEINNENSLISNWEFFNDLNQEHKEALLKRWKLWLDLAGDPVAENYRDPAKFPAKNDPAAIRELFWAFLIDIEQDYAREMVSYLKDILKVKVPVSVTQGSYSGVAGLYREANFADWIDMHAYWEHPSFPNSRWSSEDWLIRNTSMAANPLTSTLVRLAQHKMKNMPFTVSEYDHPAPNQYAAEMWPMFSSFAAFQDWDGIYHFNFGGGYEKDYFNNFFSSTGHPLKQVYVPVAAAIFRQGGVKPGNQTALLEIPAEELVPLMTEFGHEIRLHRSNMEMVFEKAGAHDAQPLVQPVEVAWQGDNLELKNKLSVEGDKLITPQEQLKWITGDQKSGAYHIDNENIKAAIGYVGGKTIQLNGLDIKINASDDNWVCLTLASLDNQPIVSSSKMLLVAAGAVENPGMEWNEDKTSVGTNWGHGPTMAEGISASLTLENVGNVKVEALDPTGDPQKAVKTRSRNNSTSFTISPSYKTLWYIITK